MFFTDLEQKHPKQFLVVFSFFVFKVQVLRKFFENNSKKQHPNEIFYFVKTIKLFLKPIPDKPYDTLNCILFDHIWYLKYNHNSKIENLVIKKYISHLKKSRIF